MSNMIISHPLALKVLMNEDIYYIDHPSGLTAENNEPDDKPAEELPVYDYLGENNRYMLMLVSTEEHPVIAPKDLEALQSVLQAKKMDLNDVAVLNIHRFPSARWQQLKEYFAFSSIILLGVSPQQIGLAPIPSNAITEHDGSRVLHTFSFAEMLSSTDKKRIFWNEMKKL